MEITEQQFNANLQNLPEMDQQNVIGIVQEIDGDELRSFAKALGVDIVMSEELAEEPMDAPVDPTMDEMPMEEPPMEAPPAEVPPVEAPPAPVQPSMDQQMQQLALGDQVVEPVPEEAMPTEAMPTEAMPAEAVPMEAAPIDAVAGPIMQEGASETGVADDVPMDAEEGAYVVNAAAIERVGVRDFEERILKPNIESLRKKGVEINLEELRSPAAQVEGDTDVAVSNGEYYLPAILVAEIGLDLLEKINKRGEQETEQRIAEEEAPVEPMQQQVQALKRGDRVENNQEVKELDADHVVFAHMQRLGIDPKEYPKARKNLDTFEKKLIEAESKGNPTAESKISTASGLYQITNETVPTALNQLEKRIGPKPWIEEARKSKTRAKDLPVEHQKSLFYANIMERPIKQQKVPDEFLRGMFEGNEEAQTKLYLYGHHTWNKNTKHKASTLKNAQNAGFKLFNKNLGQ